MTKKYLLLLIVTASILFSCRTDEYAEPIIPSTGTQVTQGIEPGEIKGFFLLNEGNMGSNKATLDYFDYQSGIYYKNIFPERNPNVVKELGDVGNDIQIHGERLYAVINCSHLVEVMDVNTARHIGAVSIPNCRYITFSGKYAYVSSYAGPVEIGQNSRLGYVAKVDTATLEVVGNCTVGYQPEQMVVIDNKLYVANSGGYRLPHYDTRVSVIDLDTFTEIKKIEVGINLHRMQADNYGNIYVSSRGDYYGTPSRTYIIDTRTDQVSSHINPLPNSNMALRGDILYLYSTEWNNTNGTNTVTYATVDTRTQQATPGSFITDDTQKRIKIPYGLAVNPDNGEIFVTDAKTYVIPGMLYCFSNDGKLRWKVETGDIPSHIVFTKKKLTNNIKL